VKQVRILAKLTRVASGALALLALGCGSDDPRLWSCDDPELEICIEYENLPPQAKAEFMRVCAFGMGTWADRGCPRDQVYVGCRLVQGGMGQTIWEKRPDTVEQVERNCPGQVVYGRAAPDAGAQGDGRR
jgi:hypothetical protein